MPPKKSVDTPVPRLVGRSPAEIVTAMRAFRSGTTARDRDGPHRQGLLTMTRSRRSRPGTARRRTKRARDDQPLRRRDLLMRTAAPPWQPHCRCRRLAQGAAGRVVVVGGGFAGRLARATLKQLDPRLAVTLVEANPTRVFTACPFSNEVIAGLRELAAQQFGYDKLAGGRVALDFSGSQPRSIPQARTVTLGDAHQARLRPAGLGARHRFSLGRAAGLRRGGRREDAACLEGRARRPCCCATSSRRWRMAASS